MKKLKDAEVYIYGTGGNGINLLSTLNNKCIIKGFIDKNAADIVEKKGIKVYTLKDLKNEDIADKIVFITIKNVFGHDDIARDLIKCGFRYIVYKSGNILKEIGDEREKITDIAYETIIEHKTYFDDIEVPKVEVINYKLRDRLFIKEDEETVTALCPKEMLFNYKDPNDYPGMCMPLFFHITDLYEAFSANEKGIEEAEDNFLIYCGEWLHKSGNEMTDAQRRSFIESKRAAYVNMRRTMELDKDFFVNNAPKVTYENGKFYLASSGRNRVSFQIAMGHDYIPVKMSKEDYDCWSNIEIKNIYEKNAEQNGVTKVFGPIPNPYLADMPVIFADYQKLFLIPSTKRIVKIIFSKHIKATGSYRRLDYEKAQKEVQNTSIFVSNDYDNIVVNFLKSVGFLIADNPKKATYMIVNDVNTCDKDDNTARAIEAFSGKRMFVLTSKKEVPQKAEIMFEAASESGILIGYSI